MIPRCSFFFANPNMAAVLFVQLALVGRFLFVRIPRTGGALMFLSTLAVILTGSRGGLLALLFGLVVATVAGRRSAGPVAVSCHVKVLAILTLLAVLACGGLGLRLCAIPHDGSVANRLLLWKSVPRMMADAPSGWGLGNSGSAFMNWYQPLDRSEEYRTMVGSHQTWLVEFGTVGRIAYLFVWLVMLTLAFRHARTTGDAQAVAQGSSLAVAATFSSVLEVGLLWVLPTVAMTRVILNGSSRRLPPAVWTTLAAGAVVPVLSVMLFWRTGEWRFEDSGRIARYVGPVREGQPIRWLVPDVEVLGEHYPRRLRAKGTAVSVAATLDRVEPDVTELVVCGADRHVACGRFSRLERIVYLSPKFRPLDCDPSRERILIGEFAHEVPDPPPAGVRVVAGAASYLESGIGDW